ncbi:MAG: response regulator [Actinomycetota bacterium]|nr:response regulator [Actinomycetota bacterium]
MSRPTRVIYVENDPTLRSMMVRALEAFPEVSIVLAAGSSEEVLASDAAHAADVALLDLALGAQSLTGVELGLALRQMNENIGIVIYSQHVIPDYVRSMQEHLSQAWSFVEKTSDIDFDGLIQILKETAAGKSITRSTTVRRQASGDPAQQMTQRQHEIMALAVQGLDAPAIAERLGVAPITVRKNLSRVYEILVPAPAPGTDLRTSAVLRYLREVRIGIGNADAL